ncbi:hypothetical protein JCM9279_006353 [Rhodotorula babjevae]
MPRPLSSYFTSSPSASTSAHSRTRSHTNLDGLLPSHAPQPPPLPPTNHTLDHTWVVPVTARPTSWDLERASDSPLSSSSHTLLHLGPSSAPSRSLSLGRAPQGLSPAAAAAPAPASSRSYRQAGLIEQGFPAPPPPLASTSTSPPNKPQWPPQQPLTPTQSLHRTPSHRQTRSVGRAAPPPPPLASSSHVRVPSLSRHSQTMLGHHDQQHHPRPRANSNSRPPMAYSPLAGGSSAPDGAAHSPYGSLGAGYPAQQQQQHYGGAGLMDGASPMRRGISYDGPASAASSRPASLLPGAYAPSSASSQSMLPVGGLPGAARDLYSPMTGVQHAAAGSSTSGSLMSGAASSTSPMAPSPRPYSPSHYAASHLQQHPGAAGYPASAPPAQRSPLLPSHSGGAPSASSFYPQHIAQSYGGGGGGGAHSPASGIHPPLPPPSAPPVIAAGAGGKLGGGAAPPPSQQATHTYPHHTHTLHHQPSLSAHLHHQHQPLHAHAQAHAHAHSASYSPGSSSTGAGAGAYAQLGSAPSSSTDLRNLSLGASGSSAPQQQQQQQQPGLRSPMQAPRRRKGLVRVREGQEIERGGTTRGGQPRGRRADPAGGFVSPLKALTTALPQTYHLVNPAFVYETSRNPRRVLTKPSKPAGNEGFDNEDSDYILYVNDVLGPEDKDRYLILDVLGQGTFGQVVKCQNMKTHEIVAVKVVKNKPAYFQQSMMEVTILELINNQWDKDDEHHMLRLKDTFIHHSHLCLVFELLSNNLYELIKQNSFRGLSTSLVRVFTAQLLDALSVLNEAKIIHCDLKPENILLKSLQSPTIKVIDFGSACHEKQTVYTYIQSRFYRSPEVILSLPYSSTIDMWSLGCICVELFLGLPLFPGTSEFNQITRIVEMLGMPPDHMLDKGKQTSHFFETVSDEYGRRRYRLKSLERYASEYKANEQPSKKYFSASTLPEIVKQYPIVRKGLKEAEVDKEMVNRLAFIDFVQGLLNLDPEQRWTPQQARLHPFVLGEPLLAPFVPPPRHLVAKGGAPSPTDVAQAKQQQQQAAMMRAQQQQAYGGAPMQQPQTPRRAQYGQPMPPQLHTPQQQPQQSPYGQAQAPRGQFQPFDQAAAAAAAQQQQQHQQHQQALARQAAQQPSLYGAAAGGYVASLPAAHHHYGGGRQRSGTDAPLPPALQRLGQELSSGAHGAGQSITPVLRRDEQWKMWESQYGAGAVAGGTGGAGVNRRISVSSKHPHLNLLQQQAEDGLNSWNSPVRANPPPSAASAMYYHSPPQPASSQFVVVDPPYGVDPILAPPQQAYGGTPSAAARYGQAPMPPTGAAPRPSW